MQKMFTDVLPSVYFDGGVLGAAGGLFLVGLLEGWTLASAIGLSGLALQSARICRFVALVSSRDPDQGAEAA